MYPYYVYTEKFPVKLYPLKDGRFQLIQEGKPGPFLPGYNYLLVETKLAQYLEDLNVESVTSRDAVILARSKNEEYHSHKEVIVGQHFNSDEINDVSTAMNQAVADVEADKVSAENARDAAIAASSAIMWTDTGSTRAFAVDEQLVFEGGIYICITSTTAGESPTTHPAKWSKVSTRAELIEATKTHI